MVASESRSHAIVCRMQDYHKLRVWKKAHGLVLNVRRTTRSFPRSGYGSLKAQLMSAIESIPFNIVEGCGANSAREFGRFLDISIKSTSEVEYQLQLARDYGVLHNREWQTLTTEVIDIRRMLCGLRAKVLTDPSRSSSSPNDGKRTTGNAPRGSPAPDVDPTTSDKLAPA